MDGLYTGFERKRTTVCCVAVVINRKEITLRHFPILLTKTLVRVAPPQVSLGSWAGLEVEETLSDTRLEQSIVRCSPPTR